MCIGLFSGVRSGNYFITRLEGKFKKDQQQTQCAYNAVANNHRPKVQSNSVNQPNNGAGKYNTHHQQAQVAGTSAFPGFIHLRNKSDARKQGAKVANHFNSRHDEIPNF